MKATSLNTMAVVACMVSILFALSPAGTQAQQPRVLRFASTDLPNSPIGYSVVKFIELVEKRSNGSLKIASFPSLQLGNLAEQIQGVKFGTIDIADNDFAAMATFMPRLSALNAPYVYRDYEHLRKVLDQEHPIMKEVNEALIKTAGIRILTPNPFGTRNLITNKPVYRPEDLKGVKIRAIPWPLYIATVEGFGAVPTPVDWAEISTAVATGAVAGLENSLGIIYENKLHRTLKYIMLTRHVLGTNAHIINEKVYQSLSPEHQRILQESAKEAFRLTMQNTRDTESQYMQKLKAEGVTFIGPEEGLDFESFRRRTIAAVVQKFENDREWVQLYRRIQEAQ